MSLPWVSYSISVAVDLKVQNISWFESLFASSLCLTSYLQGACECFLDCIIGIVFEIYHWNMMKILLLIVVLSNCSKLKSHMMLKMLLSSIHKAILTWWCELKNYSAGNLANCDLLIAFFEAINELYNEYSYFYRGRGQTVL